MAGGNGVPQNTGMVGQQMMGGLKPGPGTFDPKNFGPGTFGPTSQVPFNPNIQNVVSPTPGTGTLGPALPSGGVEELGRQSIPLIPPGGFPPPGGPSNTG
jgi:hypothetical protein